MSFITDPRKARPWQRVSIGVAAVSAFEVVSLRDLLLFVPVGLAAAGSTAVATAAVAAHRQRGTIPPGRKQRTLRR